MSNDTSGGLRHDATVKHREPSGGCVFFCFLQSCWVSRRVPSPESPSQKQPSQAFSSESAPVTPQFASEWPTHGTTYTPDLGWELLYSLQEPACRDSCLELRLWVLFSRVRVIRRRYGVQKAHTPFSDAASFQAQLSLRKSVYHGRPRDLGEGQ